MDAAKNLANKMEESGYIEEADELDALSSTFGKSSAVLNWSKGSIKGTVGSGDDVYSLKDDDTLGIKEGDVLTIQKVNTDGTYNVRRRPYRDNPGIITVGRDDISSRNPKPWYNKGASDMNGISSMIDKVASSLELKGLIKEAESLDAIANLVDRFASSNDGRDAALKAGVSPKVWAELLEPEKIWFSKWLSESSPITHNGKNSDVLDSVLKPLVAAKAEIMHENAKDTRKDLLPGIERVRNEALEDLDYVKKGLKFIPELVKYIVKANEDAMEKLMGDKKFVDETLETHLKGRS